MRLYGFLVAAFTILLALNASAIVFDDGLIHVIHADNSFPFEIVYVYDGPGSIATTVEVVTGGEIATSMPGWPSGIQAFENSIITIYDGTVWENVDVRGSSVVNISGGLIERTLFVRNDAAVNISGGEVAFSAIVYGGFVNISGGTVGGDIDGYSASNGITNISGGIVSKLYLEQLATAYVSGGEITRRADILDDAILVITGGTWGGPIFAFNSSLIEIYGSGFNYPYGEMTASSGTLTGTLLDTTPISVDFGRASTATIYLPEPSALTALGSGIAMLALLYRRRAF